MLSTYFVRAATDIGNNSNNESVTVDGGLWSTELLRIGYNFGYENSLNIINGGQVNSSVVHIGDLEGYENSATVSGIGSVWNVANTLSVGRNRGRDNQLTIDDYAVVNAGNSFVGGLNRSSDHNTAMVGSGAVWNTGANLYVGIGGVYNKLSILNGGRVNSELAYIGYTYGGYIANGNSVLVSGVGSTWVSSDTISFGSMASSMTISSGAVVVANAGISMGDPSNALNLKSGGKLEVGAAFDASQPGFHFEAGSTLVVEGQLTGLSEVEFDHRLEAVSVLGNFLVNGVLALGNSPADSTINGSLTMGSNGVLEMELGGYVAGVDSDRLTVVDISILDGTLDVSFINDLTVQNGDSFHLFDWQDWVDGTFSDIDTPVLGGGLSWDTSELYTTGNLNVIPEPAVLSLLLIAGTFGFIYRRLNS